MKDATKVLLILSGIILLAILVMQPLEVYIFLKDAAVLFPKGIIGLKERNLLLFIQALMLLVIIPVYVFTFIFSWWYRATNKKSRYDPHLVDNLYAECVWWGLPLIMTIVIAMVTWIKTYELDPYRPIESEKDPIKVSVVALQWKWLFMYPEEGIATVNYIQVPKNTPIHFEITADAPMNSFWIPDLGGQIYAMPGMRTELFLIANQQGTFRGCSANISGKGFAGMTFTTEASTEDAYKEWVQSVKQSDKKLNRSEYKKLALPTINHPEELYQLTDNTLFHEIVMKYMNPESKI